MGLVLAVMGGTEAALVVAAVTEVALEMVVAVKEEGAREQEM
jgi:hypothetical protein